MSLLKKVLLTFSITMLVTVLSSGFAYAEGNKTGTISGSSVNVRDSADTSANVITQLSNGSVVTIISESNGWYNVSFAGTTGWVYGQFLTVAAASGRPATITGDQVNMRANPSTSAEVLTLLSIYTNVEILDGADGWYKISYGGYIGWVNQTFVSESVATVVETAIKATIASNEVNFRSGSTTSSDVIRQLSQNEKVSIIGKSGDWFKVKASDGVIGWVFKDYMYIDEVAVSRGAMDYIPTLPAENSSDNITQGQKVVAYAKKLLGIKYVYGGTTTQGFDCSGFVQYVYNNFGIELNRVAADQATQGTKIKRNALVAGDVIFFDTDGGNSNVGHVGIYIGNGAFIHASSSRSAYCVTISDLNSDYYSSAYMSASRFIK